MELDGKLLPYLFLYCCKSLLRSVTACEGFWDRMSCAFEHVANLHVTEIKIQVTPQPTVMLLKLIHIQNKSDNYSETGLLAPL